MAGSASAQAAAMVVSRGWVLDMEGLRKKRKKYGSFDLAAWPGARRQHGALIRGRCGGGAGALGGGHVRRGRAIAIALAPVVVIPPLHLHHAQRLWVQLGLETAALGIPAADFVAAIIDLDALQLPALGGRVLPHGVARLPLR